jgi:hypothetical protein
MTDHSSARNLRCPCLGVPLVVYHREPWYRDKVMDKEKSRTRQAHNAGLQPDQVGHVPITTYWSRSQSVIRPGCTSARDVVTVQKPPLTRTYLPCICRRLALHRQNREPARKSQH